MLGTCLTEKTIGIMGLGRIGYATAKRFKAFEPQKIIYTATKEKDSGKSIGAEFVNFDQLLGDSDIIIVTAAFNESTKGMGRKFNFTRIKICQNWYFQALKFTKK